MIKQNYFLDKECLLSNLKLFNQTGEKAAKTYAACAEAFEGEDRDILRGIADDKKRHIEIIKNLIRLIEEHYKKFQNGH